MPVAVVALFSCVFDGFGMWLHLPWGFLCKSLLPAVMRYFSREFSSSQFCLFVCFCFFQVCQSYCREKSLLFLALIFSVGDFHTKQRGFTSPPGRVSVYQAGGVFLHPGADLRDTVSGLPASICMPGLESKLCFRLSESFKYGIVRRNCKFVVPDMEVIVWAAFNLLKHFGL